MSERTKQRSLFIVKQRPREYPLTPQQEKFRQALKECGIEKGMSRDQLLEKMINCLPQVWEKKKGAETRPPS